MNTKSFSNTDSDPFELRIAASNCPTDTGSLPYISIHKLLKKSLPGLKKVDRVYVINTSSDAEPSDCSSD